MLHVELKVWDRGGPALLLLRLQRLGGVGRDFALGRPKKDAAPSATNLKAFSTGQPRETKFPIDFN